MSEGSDEASVVGDPVATATLVDATRSLVTTLRIADAPADAVERATALVREATELLAPHQVHGTPGQNALRVAELDREQFATGDPARFFPYSPVIGPLNPVAPPLTFTFDGERLSGTGTLGSPYTGPPGAVHGGVVALVFDELLGAVNACLGLGAFTGTLTIRYERITPIEQEIAFESWVDRTEGRKVFTRGTISAGGEVTARAEGVFIRVEQPFSPTEGNADMTDLLTWGVLPADTFERVLVFSPHFDDAAMGAGHLLLAHPGSTVCTVFAGPPDRYPDEPTEWDALGGFRTGDDVVAVRRQEDLAALDVLGAEHHWLEFVDHQYLAPDARATADDVAPALAAVVDAVAPTAVVLPLGLANPDHVVTHDAGVQVAQARPDVAWFAYEDAGYKHIPGMMAWRVSKLFQSDLWPTPMIVPTDQDHARKRAAIECYVSQLAPLRADHALDARIDGAVAEQFWQLAPPPPGWERMRDAV